VQRAVVRDGAREALLRCGLASKSRLVAYGPYGRQVRDTGDMEIVVLVVPDCTNEKTAADRLREALDDVGLRDSGFTTRVVADQTEAERIGFTGSPTILIDGRDPFAEPGGVAPALTCRVYRAKGGLAGAPDLDQLRRALQGPADAV
jgi:hypothetical protein